VVYKEMDEDSGYVQVGIVVLQASDGDDLHLRLRVPPCGDWIRFICKLDFWSDLPVGKSTSRKGGDGRGRFNKGATAWGGEWGSSVLVLLWPPRKIGYIAFSFSLYYYEKSTELTFDTSLLIYRFYVYF
jgi:hypothetical protein